MVLAIFLGSSAVADQGLMRMLIPMLVAPFQMSESNRDFWLAFTRLGLPHWLFPAGNSANPATSDVVFGFYNRLPAGAPVPYAAWLIPLGGWGIFFGELFATLLAISVIVTPQWAKNERVSFPLAQLQLELIEPPARDRMLNELFRSRLFWTAIGLVMFVESLRGLNAYFPKYVPVIPLSYNLSAVFSAEPWSHLSWYVKTGTIFFTFIGLTYVIPLRISFSLWATFLLVQVVNLYQSAHFSPISDDAWFDQHLGATLAFVIGFLYVGRNRWRDIGRCLWRGKRTLLHHPGALPMSRVAAVILILGPIAMLGWMIALGMHWWMAGLILVMLLVAHLMVARVVAESGLPFVRCYANPLQVVTNLPTGILNGRDVFFTGAFSLNGSLATRQSLLAYATDAEYVADETPGLKDRPRTMMMLVGWGVLLGSMVYAIASLHCYYRYSTPLAPGATGPLDGVSMYYWPQYYLAQPLQQFSSGHFPAKSYNPWVHIGAGFGITALLEIATLRWSSWPFLPIGYLLAPTWYIQMAWVSICLGWASKTVILRLGGTKLFRQARPFFIGLIFGEALAAAMWMLISLALRADGEGLQGADVFAGVAFDIEPESLVCREDSDTIPTMRDELVSIAVGGIGGYGRIYLQALLGAGASRTTLAGCIDPEPQRCPDRELLESRGIRIFPDLPSLYASTRPTLLVLATPPHTHCDQSCFALKHGSHVLCEKPIAATPNEAQQMIRAERDSGRLLAIGYQWAFAPWIQKLKADIAEKRFGRPLHSPQLSAGPGASSIMGATSGPGSIRTDTGQEVYDSPVNNACAHFVQIMLYLLGEQWNSSDWPQTVQAELYRAHKIENYDTAMVRCRTRRQVELLLYVSHATQKNTSPNLRLEFEHGVISSGGAAGWGIRTGSPTEAKSTTAGSPAEKTWKSFGRPSGTSGKARRRRAVQRPRRRRRRSCLPRNNPRRASPIFPQRKSSPPTLTGIAPRWSTACRKRWNAASPKVNCPLN